MKTLFNRLAAFVLAALTLFGAAGCANEGEPASETPEPSAEAAANTPEPTPTPLPTPEPTPLLDLTGWKVVTGEKGGPSRDMQDWEMPGGYVDVDPELRAKLDDPENADALFKVEIQNYRPYAKMTEKERAEYFRNAEERSDELLDLVNSPAFARMEEEFNTWFSEVYFPTSPLKDKLPSYIPEEDAEFYKDWQSFLYTTLFIEGYPNYHELFLEYLCENGEAEKAESYRPLAEQYWELNSPTGDRPQALADAVRADLERLIGLGYRIDLDSFSDYSLSCFAYLTKDQIEHFAADPDYPYRLAFFFRWIKYRQYEDG